LKTKDLPRRQFVGGSRFGASLANLGDLQLDGFEDFAVGAPYDGDNHEGAIYIYRGCKDFNFQGKNNLYN
jgi:hypothetical protein